MQLARPIAMLMMLFFAMPACTGTSKYHSWLTETFPADGPGGAVLLMRDNEVLFRGAAGLANIELEVPMRPDHVMRIGSLSKQFTAAAILLLQDHGELNVSDEITLYLPELPTHGERITIAHLLSHTSGIYSFTDIPGYWNGNFIRTDVSIQELIDLFADKPLQFSPGSEFSYSNSGYVLLGAIIERITGESYAEFLRTKIFGPLGLVDTQYGGSQVVPRRTSGYVVGPDDQHRNAMSISMTHPYAAGALLSTVDDMARWNAALFAGRLFSEDAVRAMTTAKLLNDGTVTEYGYGLYVRERDGLPVIAHSGSIHGFSSSALWLPEQRIFAVVLTNLEYSRKANQLVWRLVQDVAASPANKK